MERLGIAGRVAGAFLDNQLTPLLVAASLLLGLLAVAVTPREEEPQIVVPMIDVMAGWPGAAPAEVERLVAVPLERAVRELPGVEYVYTIARPSGALLVVRFYVNEDPERALLGVRDKVANVALAFPDGVLAPQVVPRSIDDVPILALTLSSPDLDGLALRRMALELEEELRRIPDVAATTITGGLRREIRVELDAGRLAAHGLPPAAVLEALRVAGAALPSGSVAMDGREVTVEAGGFLEDAAAVSAVVVSARGGRAVHLREVATIADGPAEPRDYVLHAEPGRPPESAVTLSLAKTRGANATRVAAAALERLDAVRGRILAGGTRVTVTRDYGKSADHKSDELMKHLLLATVSVVLLMALTLGWREAVVVGIAVPVTLALTLLIYALLGYTLNRVTLFALIFSIGILVDDAIVVVENMHRHLAMRRLPPVQAALAGVDEVGNPTILATFTVVAAILPMAFVSGLMGPYMRPIPLGASFAMIVSLLVAFVVSPWAAFRLLSRESHAHGAGGDGDGPGGRLYRRVMGAVLDRPRLRGVLLVGVVVLLLGSLALVPLKLVTVKMLPFDDKSELQVVVDAPESLPLEATLAAAAEMAQTLLREPEVRDVQVYAGTSAPFNFNGLVRHYFLRRGASVADLQVNLLPADARRASSHAMALRVRPLVTEVAARHGVRVKVAEIPPGPPVLSTLVAEVYGDDTAERTAVARQVLQIFETTPGVVDADWTVEDPQPRLDVVLDREKATLAGVDARQAVATLRLAVDGLTPVVARPGGEREAVPVVVRLGRAARSSAAALGDLRLASASGTLVPLQEIAALRTTETATSLYRKNGRPVTYVLGEVAGTEESPGYAILGMSERITSLRLPDGTAVEERLIDDPASLARSRVVWDGEWRITVEVFRDLGIAFGAVLILVYMLVVAWFGSLVLPLLIMAPIPLTLVGILPGHAATGMFFTATSMIGMIALAGIIVRNSILLVDFVELSLQQGVPLRQAVLDAGAVRMRPIVLTAAAVIVGGAVIVLDPIFQGLAVALISGVFASTALTLVVIPLLYLAWKGRAAR